MNRAGLFISLLLPAILLPQDSTVDVGVNCSYKAEPDKFTSGAARAQRMVYENLRRVKPRSPEGVLRANQVPGGVERRSFIDDLIFDRLNERRVAAARLSTDEEFVRRIYLDLTGRIPTPQQARDFIANDDATKRDALINQLLQSPEFVDKWTMWLGDLLGNASNNGFFNLQAQGRNAFYTWLKTSLQNGLSLKDMSWQIITGKGNNFESGPANYILRNSTPGGPVQDTYDTATYRASRDFLGMGHMDCILCHNGRGHLDQISLWGRQATRTDALKMSAFFSRIRFVAITQDRTVPEFNARSVTDATTGQYDLNTNFGNRPNRLPIGTTRSLMPEYRQGQTPTQADWRADFAEFMVKDPMFAVNFANRIWKQVFNLALAEPIDQLDPLRLDLKNPPAAPWTFQASHPELLQRLADEFVARDYNLRDFVRLLVTSNAYQLSSEYDGEYKLEWLPLFARHYPRRLEGEEVHDAIIQTTQVIPNYNVGLDKMVNWAMQMPEPTLPGGAAAWMNTFYRGNRSTTDRMQSGSIQQRLALANDTFITTRLKVGTSPVLRAMAGKAVAQEIIDDMWMTFLTRKPTLAEKQAALQPFLRANSPALKNAAIEDLAWALVNKLDFIFSY